MTIEEYLHQLGPRGEGLRLYHKQNIAAFDRAQGSGHNHQAWPGGYRDHLTQCLQIAGSLYDLLCSRYGHLPFGFDSVVVAVYLHDWEKQEKYGNPDGGKGSEIDKHVFLNCTLPGQFGFELTEEELEAVRFAHGEGGEYRKDGRAMGRLAGFVHSVDVLSARVLHDLGAGGRFGGSP